MATSTGHDTLKSRKQLNVNGKKYDYFSLDTVNEKVGDISRLPFSLKILLENLLRYEDDRSVTSDDIKAMVDWQKDCRSDREIAYRPARVLLQDFTGVPAVVDLAAMRAAMDKMGGNPNLINPLSPVDLVIDHSVMIDYFGGADSFEKNVNREFERNGERYSFLRWGQEAFNNFRIVPPGTGICHQVNLEYLSKTVWSDVDQNGNLVAYPDTLVGTDSHTTMVNGLGVLGWGVGGIEAEAAMLGQPVSMLIPEVIGFRLTGQLSEGITATDLVLRVVEILRQKGVVSKFVEFCGTGLDNLSLADRATIGNMAPEYGATCGIFPVDKETLNYLRFTGRDDETLALVEAYAKAQGMWRDASTRDPLFTDMLELDLAEIRPALAGPKRPQDRVLLTDVKSSFAKVEKEMNGGGRTGEYVDPISGKTHQIENGSVAIAAITSCTNTSNPSVLVAAGLLARKALAKGLSSKPWVKTSLAPGSQVVTDYLKAAGLQKELDGLGFTLVGYGCTTCIGNSGPISEELITVAEENDLILASVLSGNRNFEGRVSPNAKVNYLASPPLVVAYAIAGSLNIDVSKDSLGDDQDGNPVYLKDIWPSNKEIRETIEQNLTPAMFRERYSDVFTGTKQWQDIKAVEGKTYHWGESSTYVQHPPYFEDMGNDPSPAEDISGAKILLMLGDSITTDHISPAGSFKDDTPAGKFLTERQVPARDFNSYGARRGNHEVMMRGTFGNIRIKNELAQGREGGFSIYEGDILPVFDVAMKHKQAGTPLIVVAGKEYGTGSSRDWAAKGTRLLGVGAVIAESFERIHRSNLIGMGVLPLQFKDDATRKSLKLDGSEAFDITGVSGDLKPKQDMMLHIHRADGLTETVSVLCRIDTLDEVEYYRHGGILQYVLRNLYKENQAA